MKEILCYGDSNTWGFTPATGARYPYAVRWPGVLGALLGSGCRITENGVNGRTTVFNDPDFPCRNGKTGLGYALCAGKPFDLVILMLGTNDLKFTDAAGAARGAAELVALLQNANARFPAQSASCRTSCSPLPPA
jgi:lysophospholipase L1-like esterase